MFDVPTETALDLVIVLCLVPMIVYAFIHNRRLSELRRSRDELARVVSSFNEASIRAEAKIPKLKKTTIEANKALQDRVEKAQIIRDDLAFMNERAEVLVKRLEDIARSATAESVSTVVTKHPASSRAMLRGGVEPSVAAQTLAGAAAAASDETSPNRSEPEDRVEADSDGAENSTNLWPTETHPTIPKGMDEERSETEQALLKALESAR